MLTNPAYAGWQLPGFRTTSQFGVTVAFISLKGPGHQDQTRRYLWPMAAHRRMRHSRGLPADSSGGSAAISVIRFSRARWKPDSR